MKLKTFLLINASVSCFFGLSSLLIPSQIMMLHGMEPTPAVCLLAQISGLGTLAAGLVTWFFRNIEISQAKNTLIPALLTANSIGTIISVMGAISGAMKGIWPTAGLYFVFALGYFYFQVTKTKSA
jgi:hypothetical protein